MRLSPRLPESKPRQRQASRIPDKSRPADLYKQSGPIWGDLSGETKAGQGHDAPTAAREGSE